MQEEAATLSKNQEAVDEITLRKIDINTHDS